MEYRIGRKNSHYVLAHLRNGKPIFEPFPSIGPVVAKVETGIKHGDIFGYGIPSEYGQFEPLTADDIRRLNGSDIATIVRSVEETNKRPSMGVR